LGILHHNATTGHAHGDLAHVDPRLRIVAALGWALVVASSQQFVTLGIALAVALVAIVERNLFRSEAPKNGMNSVLRLLPLEVLVLLLVLLLPLTTPGTPLVQLGRLKFSQEGLLLAARIALKANALVLGLVALFAGMDGTTLGHTLAHLYVPQKLTHLLLLTVRYLDVLHREYRRMRSAMKVRCFRPRVSMHTYRTFGHLIGMLLVRSFDRSERIMAAMKCRGFRGRFYLLDHFAFSRRRDVPFCLASLALLGLLACVEWL
jgi:cobalt/nickel transport system permease protein